MHEPTGILKTRLDDARLDAMPREDEFQLVQIHAVPRIDGHLDDFQPVTFEQMQDPEERRRLHRHQIARPGARFQRQGQRLRRSLGRDDLIRYCVDSSSQQTP